MCDCFALVFSLLISFSLPLQLNSDPDIGSAQSRTQDSSPPLVAPLARSSATRLRLTVTLLGSTGQVCHGAVLQLGCSQDSSCHGRPSGRPGRGLVRTSLLIGWHGSSCCHCLSVQLLLQVSARAAAAAAAVCAAVFFFFPRILQPWQPPHFSDTVDTVAESQSQQKFVSKTQRLQQLTAGHWQARAAGRSGHWPAQSTRGSSCSSHCQCLHCPAACTGVTLEEANSNLRKPRLQELKCCSSTKRLATNAGGRQLYSILWSTVVQSVATCEGVSACCASCALLAALTFINQSPVVLTPAAPVTIAIG